MYSRADVVKFKLVTAKESKVCVINKEERMH